MPQRRLRAALTAGRRGGVLQALDALDEEERAQALSVSVDELRALVPRLLAQVTCTHVAAARSAKDADGMGGAHAQAMATRGPDV